MNHDFFQSILWSFQSITLLNNNINWSRNLLRKTCGKVTYWMLSYSAIVSISCQLHWVVGFKIERSSRVARSSEGLVNAAWMVLHRIVTLELGNGGSWYHMCAFRFHFWGRKVKWNQASHVRGLVCSNSINAVVFFCFELRVLKSGHDRNGPRLPPLAPDLRGCHVDQKGKSLHEDMAYRSLSLRNIQLEVSEKLPQG